MNELLTLMGKRIRDRRVALNMSQTELANRAGYSSRSSINKVEKGIVDIPQSKIEVIAEVLMTTPDYLLGKADERSAQYNQMILDVVEPYRIRHDLSKEQMEEYLDWKDMYDELESGRVITSGAFLDVVKTILDVLEAPVPDLLPGVHPIKLKRFPVLGNVACGEPIFAEEERGTYLDAAADIDADFCLIASGDSMINARIFDGDVLFVKKQEMVDDGEIAVILIGDEATVKRVYYDRENNVITLVPENPTHKPMRFEGAKLDEIKILGKVVAGQYTI